MLHENATYGGISNATSQLHYEQQQTIMMILFGACLLGAIVGNFLQLLYIPAIVLCGTVFGVVTIHVPQIEYSISPELFFHTFMPLLIFSCAFEIDFHAFRKSILKVIPLALPGLLLMNTVITLIVVKLCTFKWDWSIGMMLGGIVGTSDPFLATNLLQRHGSKNPLMSLVEGESLLSNGMSIIIFEVFKDLASQLSHVEGHLAVKIVLKLFGSPFLGLIMAQVMKFWLSYIFNDGCTETVLSLAMAYITFYLAESLGMSGAIAVLIMGLLLDKLDFSTEIRVPFQRLWEMLGFLANTSVFFLVGTAAGRAFEQLALNDLLNLVVVCSSIYCIRLVVVVAVSPLLARIIHGFSWRWAVVYIWTGTKGALYLSLTLMAYHTEGLDQLHIRDKIVVLSSGIVILTTLINATAMTMFLKLLGLSNVPAMKNAALRRRLQRMWESTEDTLSLMKMDRYRANTNWPMAAKWVHTEDPHKTTDKKVEARAFERKNVSIDDCVINIPREWGDMMEEAQMHMLKAQKASYWSQYNSGMLNREAAKTLINTAENIWEQEGNLMSVQDLKKDWQLKGFFVSLKKKLEDMRYDVKVNKLKPSRNAVLKRCYRLVFSRPFEYFTYVLILLNIIPIVLEFIPDMSDRYELEISISNYVFFTLYVIEAILKALAMRRAYIFNRWNLFDIFIILMAAVDIILDHCIGVENINIHVIKISRVFKMLRLSRALRLTKLIIPKLIKLIDWQIHKQLSVGYGILKGYVTGEEDSGKIIDRITDKKTISQKLKRNFLKNREQAFGELGLLEKHHREIAISVKTMQAIRAVLKSQKDALLKLICGGLLGDTEASKLKKIIEKKMKLTKFPRKLPSPTAEELLENVPWVNRDQLQFIKRTAKLFDWNVGGIIMNENEEPRGMHLIVSGMIKTTGSRLNLGGKEPNENIQVTDYKTSGTIIGELNCLTRQPMEMTASCETDAQTCFLSIDSLLEAFDMFSEFPSLEYKIWHSLAMDICTKFLKLEISNEAYLVDVEMNCRFDVYDGNMENVLLVYGSCYDSRTLCSYNAPALISRNSHQIKGTAKTTKLLIVPIPSAEVREANSWA